LLPGDGGGRGIDCALACPANNNGAAERAAIIIIMMMMVVTKNIRSAFDDKNRCQKFKHNRFVASERVLALSYETSILEKMIVLFKKIL
jgi:hypothetical protein